MEEWIYKSDSFGQSERWEVNFLWRHDNIYVMDNHLCAAWCWMQECIPGTPYSFIHIDAHDDLASNKEYNNETLSSIEPDCSFQDYRSKSFIHPQAGKIPFFQFDNYIAICQFLYPEWFKKSLFYTKQCSGFDYDYESCKLREENSCHICSLSEDNKLRDDLKITGHRCCDLLSIDEAIRHNLHNEQIIMNIDLDYFFNNEYALLDPRERDSSFTDDSIRTFSSFISQMIEEERIKVLTIALSPECCFGWDKSLTILSLFAEGIAPLKESDIVDEISARL